MTDRPTCGRTGRIPTQAGFGLLETLAGLVVFVILAMAGTKAYRTWWPTTWRPTRRRP